MSAWMIVLANIGDREKFISGYGAAAASLIGQFAPGAQMLEGEGWDGASVVVSEWPDKASALAFWNSPEYAEAKKLRVGLADCSILLIGD